jgi:prepilin peptidase CpaA
MQGDFSPILLWLLAVMLLVAAIGDLRSREISNWLNGSIACLAIPFWFSLGMSPWPDMAIQLAIGVTVFAAFATLYHFGGIGGGDVKMIAALSLWFPFGSLVTVLVVMSLAGGVLTLGMIIRQRMLKTSEKIEIPYGVAIAFAGLWAIAEPFLNQFA